MDQFNVYKDMKARTNGEIYIGVVGPVRTGKSTFIKRFMNLMVLPKIEDEKIIFWPFQALLEKSVLREPLVIRERHHRGGAVYS
jgi:GTPase SAR1 family protein